MTIETITIRDLNKGHIDINYNSDSKWGAHLAQDRLIGFYEDREIGPGAFIRGLQELEERGVDIPERYIDLVRNTALEIGQKAKRATIEYEANVIGLELKRLQTEKALRMLSDQGETLKRISRSYGKAA